MTRHSHCNDLKIERIGTAHINVSRKAERQRVVTGQMAMWMDNWSQIVCRQCKCRIELRVKSQRLHYQSWITNDSEYQFGDLCYTASEPQCQLTIDMMKSSIEQWIFTNGDCCVRSGKLDQPVNNPSAGSRQRQTVTSLPRCRPRVYYSPQLRAQPWSRLDDQLRRFRTTIIMSHSI